MHYIIKANSFANTRASIHIKQSEINFGIGSKSEENLANPAELFLGSLSACILKSLERMSVIMRFAYTHAEINVEAIRHEKPARMDDIKYSLNIYSDDHHLNISLLKRNIENFGTIFNTIKTSCSIAGEINQIFDQPFPDHIQ